MQDRIPSISAGHRLQWESQLQHYILLYPEGLVKLNASAAYIFRLCDGKNSVQDILSILNGRFPDREVDRDVIHFLMVAYEKGWLK